MRFARGWTPALVGGVFLIVTVVGIGLAAWSMPALPDSALAGSTVDGDTEFGFENVAAERGFEYTATDDTETTVGNSRGGVYVTDFNNDGQADLLATGGEQPVLFENTGGQYEHSDSLPAELTPTGALFFDYDNDGWEDLLVFEWDSSPTFFENEEGTFEQREVGFDEGLTVSNAATTLDYDYDCGSLVEAVRDRFGREWDCPDCDGDLEILQRGGLLAGCEHYPDCETGFAIPQGTVVGECDCGLPRFETASGERCLDTGCGT